MRSPSLDFSRIHRITKGNHTDWTLLQPGVIMWPYLANEKWPPAMPLLQPALWGGRLGNHNWNHGHHCDPRRWESNRTRSLDDFKDIDYQPAQSHLYIYKGPFYVCVNLWISLLATQTGPGTDTVTQTGPGTNTVIQVISCHCVLVFLVQTEGCRARHQDEIYWYTKASLIMLLLSCG